MLSDVKKNIEKLIALYEGERQQKIELAAALEEKEAELDSCRKHIADLERQVDNLKLKGAFTTDAGNLPPRCRLELSLSYGAENYDTHR